MSEIIIGKHTLESLTSGMYADPYVVFREYIQNSTDAIDSAYKEAYENYLSKGSGIINTARDEEWEKVMVQGIREPRAL